MIEIIMPFDLHVILGVLSGFVTASILVPYVWSMFYGTTRPSMVSQGLWFFITILTIAAQYAADGLSLPIIFGLVVIFNNAVILMVCLMGYAYRGHSWIDFVSAGLALIGIYLWWLTSDPLYGLALSIFANACAGFPTYRKTYLHPESESILGWSLLVLATILSIASVQVISFAALAFPVFCFLEASMIVIFILQRPKGNILGKVRGV